MKRRNGFLYASLVVVGLLSFVRFIDSTEYLILDIFSQFPFQYALGSLVLTACFFRKKLFACSMLAGLLFIFNISAVQLLNYIRQIYVKITETFQGCIMTSTGPIRTSFCLWKYLPLIWSSYVR